MAADRRGVALEGTVGGGRGDIIVPAVEGERRVVQTESQFRYTDIVLRRTEADSKRVVVLGTGYTADEVN